MIIKPHIPTIYSLMLENLLRRLPKNHPNYSKVAERLSREKAGYHGEQRLDYSLSKLDFKHFTLHDVRLPYHHTYFQIDTLIVTPRFLLAIEVKAYRGQVLFRNDFSQTIQQPSPHTTEKVYDDPIVQVEEQKFQLTTWLEHQRIPPLPIETLVVMTHPHVILQASDRTDYFRDRVIPLSKLSSKLREINQKYKQEFMNLRESKHLAQRIAKAHTHYTPNILKRWKLEFEEILPGVCCPQCTHLGMERKNRRWECVRCGHRSIDAHISALKDYYLLGNKTITNREFREFTGVESASSAKHMLRNLQYAGERKQRKYLLSYDSSREFLKK
ncbi:nuclease-related domain-containing protein [Allobacillus halotolerans]|uniref:NERD domain-containing protein n=1 Tax=Allobacillus halotolerans TaxID=570278 RepID=A0ABS6GQY1_9BACI|nr:nuclease-related domain-containing protein [Allobacillus halotolerans]MBU6080903.1 NERD domain-containing protein [Allobacillus halotolerans]